MKRNTNLAAAISIVFAALMVLGGAGTVDAQGRYVGQLSRNDVNDIIRRMEDSADEFRQDFIRELDRSNLSSGQKRTYRNQVNSFENATDRLRSNFDNDDNWWQSRNQVQNVVSNARPINTTMNSIAFRRNIERQWNQLRNNVNRLADTFDLPGIAGGGWNGGPWNPGNPGNPGYPGTGNRPPSWAIGTWYWTNGSDRRMTINANGTVTVDNQGRPSNGRYRNGTIVLDGVVSTLTQYGNGIRTYNRSSGEVSDYVRYGGGGGGGGVNISRPPNWAVGNWRWVQGSGRTMSIARTGEITVVNQGRYSRGTWYNGTITLDGVISRVTRNGSRIRTYNQSSGEVSDYVRN